MMVNDEYLKILAAFQEARERELNEKSNELGELKFYEWARSEIEKANWGNKEAQRNALEVLTIITNTTGELDDTGIDVIEAFTRFRDELPLTAIEDSEEEFVKLSEDSEIKEAIRYPSLICDEDGIYHDSNRYYAMTENGNTFKNNYIEMVVDECFPINLPYLPEKEEYIADVMFMDDKDMTKGYMLRGIRNLKGSEVVTLNRYFLGDQDSDTYYQVEPSEYLEAQLNNVLNSIVGVFGLNK